MGLRHIVDNLGEIDARALNSTPIGDVATLRFGKYGPYLEIADPANPEAEPRRVNIPEDLAPDELTPAKAQELIDAPVAGDRVLGENPENGKLVVVKDGRFGPYVQEVDPPAADEVDEETGEVIEAPSSKRRRSAARRRKPLRSPARHRCSSRCRSRRSTSRRRSSSCRCRASSGVDPESGAEITAQNGRYGPYLKKGTDSRTLQSEDQLFDITLDEALAVYAQPKYGARGASSALKEFEADPVSGKPIKVKDGRFGPYVTDGETNATIPRGETVEAVDFERAVQLLADKRAKGPAPKRTTRTTTRKAPAKK